MREITHNEVAMVSGAGLAEIISGLGTAMTNVSTSLETTVNSLATATSRREIRGLTHKAMSLSHSYAKLSFLSDLLSSFNTTTDTTETVAP